MSRKFRTNLAILLVAVAMTAAIKAWTASLLTGSDSAGATQAREVIYRPQHLLVY